MWQETILIKYYQQLVLRRDCAVRDKLAVKNLLTLKDMTESSKNLHAAEIVFVNFVRLKELQMLFCFKFVEPCA